MPAHHVFHSIYLHFVWHCQGNQPLIDEKWEHDLYDFIRDYCRKEKGVYLQAIGGTATHVHLAVQVEPAINPSEFIGKVKGASSFEMNRIHGENTLKWQRGFGAVSFSERHLGAVKRYVDRQKEHHAEGTTNEVLKRSEVEKAPRRNDKGLCESTRPKDRV
jgi:putative transposase